MTKGFHPTFTITNRITSGLTIIERARGFLEAAALPEAWVREVGRRALILEAHHTMHIEGTKYLRINKMDSINDDRAIHYSSTCLEKPPA